MSTDKEEVQSMLVSFNTAVFLWLIKARQPLNPVNAYSSDEWSEDDHISSTPDPEPCSGDNSGLTTDRLWLHTESLRTSGPPRRQIASRSIDNRWPGMVMQPEVEPVSQEQLTFHIKPMYERVFKAESACIQFDIADARRHILNPTDRWQSLVTAHLTLLHEHIDCFLLVYYPSASSALRQLPSKYSMLHRLWDHGIFRFLTLLKASSNFANSNYSSNHK